MTKLVVQRGLVIPAEDLSWTAARASGPGGQNVNKVASKVLLLFDLQQTAVLSYPQKTRLRAAAKHLTDRQGNIQIVSQESRSQRRNLEIARSRLRELIRENLAPPKKRKPTKPTRGAKRRRLDDKRRQSEKKQARRGDYK